MNILMLTNNKHIIKTFNQNHAGSTKNVKTKLLNFATSLFLLKQMLIHFYFMLLLGNEINLHCFD